MNKHFFTIGILIIFLVLTGYFIEAKYGVFTTMVSEKEADSLVDQGREKLRERDIVEANNYFKQAVTADKNNQAANFFYGITRILVLVEQNSLLKNLLDRFGFDPGGRSIYNFTSRPPKDQSGNYQLPADSPDVNEIISFLNKAVLPELKGSYKNFDKLKKDFSVNLLPSETVVTLSNDLGNANSSVEIDYGDILIFKSGIKAFEGLMNLLLYYNFNMDIDDANSSRTNGTFLIKDFINNNPEFGIRNKNSRSSFLRMANFSFINAINLYLQASDSIRKESDPQENDLFYFDKDKNSVNEEKNSRDVLNKIKASFSGPVIISTDPNKKTDDFKLNLKIFFRGIPNLRVLLPEFDNANNIIPNTFPDPTFKGILPGFNQQKLNTLFHLGKNQ